MKFNPVGMINKLLDNKKFVAAFSVVCAVIFWLVIDITENPSRDVTLSGIPVHINEQTDDNGNILTVIGDFQDEVTVTVTGPGYIVSNVSRDDITVSVLSYANVTSPGTYVLDLTASINRSGCSIARISPSYITVNYDYDASTEIPVEIDTSEFQQYVATDCEIYRSILRNNSDGADIEMLPVSGPSEIVRSLSRVVVKPVIPAGGAESVTQNFETQIIFFDAYGNPVDDVQLVYNTDTYVRIVVYKTADVKLVPTFTNMPQVFADSETGMPPYSLSVFNELTRVNEEITQVKVKGPVDTVNELLQKGLSLSPIDFLEVNPENTSFNVSFILADGVEVVDGTEEVTVSLSLGRLTTKTITVQPSNIQFDNLAAGMTASTSYKRNIRIVICGRSAVLRQITADNLKIYVDCSAITAATVETKALSVSISGALEAWVNTIDPTEVSIIIE